MKLDLSAPPGWRSVSSRPTVFETDSGSTLTVGPMTELPFVVADWEKDALVERVPGEVQLLRRVALRTVNGWPISLVVSNFVTEEGLVERRAHLFYRFRHHGVVVVIHGPEAAEVEGSPLLAALLEARPDWRQARPSNLHQLWEGF